MLEIESVFILLLVTAFRGIPHAILLELAAGLSHEA